MEPNQENAKRTYFWDRARAGFAGIAETGYGGFALIIAIQVYQAPDTVKGLIAAAGPLGLLVNPLTLSLFSRIGQPSARIAAWIGFLSGLLMLVAAFSSSLWGFLVPVCLAFALASQAMPMLVHVWTENYPSNRRGAYLAGSMMFSIGATLIFSLAGGRLLDIDLRWYRAILLVLSFAYFGTAWVMSRIPSTPVNSQASQNPLRNLWYAIEDWKFGIMLLGWMFLGFGNLMVLPLRFEYLLQPQYGIEASKTMVTLMTFVIPALFRLATSKFWGALFDRIDFMLLRMLLNGMIMVSIILFLTTKSLWVIGISAAILGTAMAGANISWSLWVTKFAAPQRTAAYMSVHTFLTGIRGILAPFLGFYLISGIGARGTAWTGSILVLISILMVACLYASQTKRHA
ncbi:MFS transporter [Pelagicoccus sp. SDUM812003]|uniref:MFS transporter n=1 Tax=Pelagicoccus sp. SDUM812003 TaxID=3041267 RepID=UPI00280EE18F|nr:MFS transporter [Pelagicoccus sp. SDUM812003]MDQ8204434.1 MFS transporter [Pelagicoccus sp. SDUM812003]